jgi:Tfp pilus assembly protein FimV
VFAAIEIDAGEQVRNESALPAQLRAVLENVPVGDVDVQTTIDPDDTATEDQTFRERLHTCEKSVRVPAVSAIVPRVADETLRVTVEASGV